MNRPMLVLALLPAITTTTARADGPGPGQGGASVVVRLKEIDTRYQDAVKKIYASKNEADEKVATEEFMALRPALVAEALALAEAHPGDPADVDAWTWVVHNGGPAPEARTRALNLLRREGIHSDRLGEACRWAANTFGMQAIEGERLLREAIEANPHREIRGRANFYLAELLEARADTLRGLDAAPPEYKKAFGEEALRIMAARPVDDIDRESGTLYDLVARDYADLASIRPGKTLGEVAEGRAYKLRNLAVGKSVPEISGEDVEGRPLKLSDHKGKVILLTFSGQWCPSCHTLYPQERELLKRYAGRPFAALSVDTDEDREPLRRAIAAGEITWPCWFDGGKGGPITLGLGIYYFPTVFLIDHKGIVRAKDIQGDSLDEAVAALIKAAEGP